MTKRKKYENKKIHLILMPPLPSQDGGRVVVSPTFLVAKIFENFINRYMGIWTKGGYIDQMAILAKTQKGTSTTVCIQTTTRAFASLIINNSLNLGKSS